MKYVVCALSILAILPACTNNSQSNKSPKSEKMRARAQQQEDEMMAMEMTDQSMDE